MDKTINTSRPAQAQTLKQPPKRRWGLLALPVILLLICCGLALVAGIGYNLLRPAGLAGPVVFFRSPARGQRLEVGNTVSVQAIARDERKVTRLELWVNGVLQSAQNSNLPGGISPFPLLVNWQPDSPGSHTLTARAFNSQGGRTQATIVVEAIPRIDSDQDGTPDESDACPNQPGGAIARGCPDADGDGIADGADACPAESGLPENDGCPAPSAADRDGDGVLDESDACPDEAGSPVAGGCPDADGDGVADRDDSCPAEPGPAESGGCPSPEDSAAGGIEEVPGEAGPGGAEGAPGLCPDTTGLPDRGAGDLDADGLSDDVDLCPDEAGLPEDCGCPPPGMGEDSDGDGIPDEEEAADDPLSDWDIEPFIPEDEPLATAIQFQALEFQINEDYDSLTCYAGLGSVDMDRMGPYDITGAQRWDLVASYGDESYLDLFVRPDEPLEVHASCGAEVTGGLGPGGGWGTYYDLGTINQLHPPSDWDGHIITVSSTDSPDGRSFQVSYRICQPSCENTAMPAPHLTLFHVGNDHRLIWYWDGDPARRAGYKFYLNGSHLLSAPTGTYSLSVGDFEPPCGERYEFQVSVYDEAGQESALSNKAYWTAPACKRWAQVTFDSLDVHDPPADEDGLHRPGPIYGVFYASTSSDIQSLPFDACWCYFGPGMTFWGWCEGYKLQHGLYSIPSIFDWIDTQMASCLGGGCHSNDFRVPGSNVVTLELPPGEDLTIGASIMDCDERSNPDDTLFDDQQGLTINTSGPTPPPIRWTLPGDYVDVNVIISILTEGQ
jgi:hypothetical protein